MKFLTTVFALSLIAQPVFAQDAAGNDTPGDWVVDHYKPFGLWDSICDYAERDGAKVDRCYLRYVDVFSPAPKFAAQFVFITPEKVGYKIEFGIEKGTLFKGESLKISIDDEEKWAFDPNNCLNFGECVFEGKEAEELIKVMAQPHSNSAEMISQFADRHGVDQDLRWDLAQFSNAVEDFTMQAKQRDLIAFE